MYRFNYATPFFLNLQLDIHVFPGLKLCANCHSKLSSVVKSTEKLPTCSSSIMEDLGSTSLINDDVFVSPQHGIKIANEAAEVLGITPVRIDARESKSARLNQIIKKGEQIRGKFEQVLQESLIDEIEIPANSECDNFLQSDLKKLMTDLRERCSKLKLENDQSSILTLLTLAPVSWTISNTAQYFDVTESEVRRARIFKKEKGIMGVPNKRKGRSMSDEEKQIIKEFYESDEHSRMQPGMKDTVSVRVQEGQKKVKIRKRLLLMNIDELYYKFKEYCSNTVRN